MEKASKCYAANVNTIAMARKAGIRIAFGTDFSNSKNTAYRKEGQEFEAMVRAGMTPWEAIQAGTINAAHVMRKADKLGSLEVGKKADLIVIDPHGPSMMPVNDKIAALVTAMHSNNIQSTMCNGKWLMKDRVILHLDEEAILKEGAARAAAIYKRAGIELPDRFPVVKVNKETTLF